MTLDSYRKLKFEILRRKVGLDSVKMQGYDSSNSPTKLWIRNLRVVVHGNVMNARRNCRTTGDFVPRNAQEGNGQ